jgi:rRNA processing protein Gar1
VTYSFFERGMGLQRLGKVMSVTPSRNLVVKTEKAPKIGSAVVDENLKVIGKVFDVIGAVPSPYAVIRPTIKEHERLSNKQLYLMLSKKTGAKNDEWR